MDLQNDKRFVEKHGPDAKPDSVIKNEILKRTHKNEVPCAVAFEIAKELQVSPDAVGKMPAGTVWVSTPKKDCDASTYGNRGFKKCNFRSAGPGETFLQKRMGYRNPI